VLVGRRLRLVQYDRSDVDTLVSWMNDPAYWGPYYNVWTSTRTEWETLVSKEPADDKLSLFIRSREDDAPLGTIGYLTPSRLSSFFRGYEIWYQVHPDNRGRGIGTEAAAILINHLFSAEPVERIQATVVVGNDASCRVLEKAGMQRDGLLRKQFFLRGRYVDMHLYAIVRDDWTSEDAYAGRVEF
jgi:ribosomal-protein-alanine N-acetyltransferase